MHNALCRLTMIIKTDILEKGGKELINLHPIRFEQI